ncbi:MAG: hypothetical protein DRP02_02615 [Candidatus Gerdarchaeota archaeon]|nr:MAG: hypothetical protein DRP02_02615 [Candidatus Gerdarchaeota archaeon]
MEKQIGAVVARTFQEVCEKSNKRAKKDFSKISEEEVAEIEKLLKKIDDKSFNFIAEIKKYLQITEGE